MAGPFERHSIEVVLAVLIRARRSLRASMGTV
jgi:hypothetical protein